jgi:hypothetical protein
MAYTDIDKSDEYFNTVLYAGNSGTQSITGVNFQPDFLWIKRRTLAGDHNLVDVIRTSDKTLISNSIVAEYSNATITSFDSDGFSLSGTDGALNASGSNYVAWNWLAGGTGVSNTNGSIASTVSANTTSGFSIVSWTGNATSGATVGHSLTATPSLIIVKDRSTSFYEWQVYHKSLGATKFIQLSRDDGEFTGTNRWNDTEPTSIYFTLGNSANVNGSGVNYIAYCFAEKKGFSKFGSYTGNGSSDGPFVYTGFKPAFFMIKRTDTTTNWIMYDKVRQPYNTTSPGPIYANLASAEESNVTLTAFDILSNGFKPRNTSSWAESNASGGTYIYMAFAENPFVTSTGIPTTAR